MVRMVIIPVVMWLMYIGDPVSCMVAAWLYAGAAITDFLDGFLARKMGLVSLTGKFLDPLADKLIVMATLVMMVQTGDIQGWIVALILAREISITALRAIASAEGIVIAARGTARYKTAFQLVGLLMMVIHYEYPVNFGVATIHVNFDAAGYVLVLLSVVLGLWSAGEYFWGFVMGLGSSKTHEGA